MKTNFEQASEKGSSARFRWILRFLVAASVLVVLIGLLRYHSQHNSAVPTTSSGLVQDAESVNSSRDRARSARHRSSSAPATTAEEIVAAKVAQFGRSRRDIVRAIARRTQKQIPPEVEAFFDAVESGHWEEIEARWKPLAIRSGQYEYSTNVWEELNPFWPAVLDAYGVAEQAHLWPAQKLLDYGNAILDSLRLGMVYVGGTDNGRWIPELLNETSGADPHIIVTQNAFADGRYLEYMNTLYGERFSALTSEDSQQAFQEYTRDAQKRFEHDQQFPNQPKQVRAGEDIRMVDGKVQVSGQVAVMAINEKLLQMLMQKNPELSFAIQESFPMRGTYADALPLGPLMELRAQDGTLTAERAAQSLDYWRGAAEQILADPEAASSEATLKSYSHDASSTANLLAAHDFTAEAEQAYRLATQLWPENPESIANLADLLANSGRETEAKKLLEDFTRQYPNHDKDLERFSAAWRVIASERAISTSGH